MEIADPIYGQIQISEPVLLELLTNPALLRLKGVDQNSARSFIDVPWGNYSRFDHSMGVMWLIKILGGGLEEQVAGLLHDISHTAFSHAMDFVFDKAETQDFHESQITRVLSRSTIPEILKRYGYQIERIIDHRQFSILEQDLPKLCADRVDYALKTFWQALRLSDRYCKKLLAALMIVNAQIVFTDAGLAYQFAKFYLAADETVWGSSLVGTLPYHLFAKIVKTAYQKGQITFDDFFTTDQEFLKKLDANSRQQIAQIRNVKYRKVGPNDDYDYHLKAKTRYVDPDVLLSAKETKKLSEINEAFRKELDATLKKHAAGNYVKIIS